MEEKEPREARMLVTHFYRRSPEIDGWIQTTYVTRKEFSDDYFHGQSNAKLPIEKIESDVEIGSLILLDISRPLPIHKGETVWIASDQSVYIANAKAPLNGNQRAIYKDNISSIYDYIEKIIDDKIASKETNVTGQQIELLFSESYWKTLVDILIKKIKKGQIDQYKFKRIGYIFAQLEPKYNKTFDRLLNEHDVAFFNGMLHFTDKHFNHQQWGNISINPEECGKYLPAY